MYDRILVPTDGGEHATAALEHALELASVHDATVHVCYVVDTSTNPLVVSKDEVRDALRQVGEDAAARAFADAEERAAAHGVELLTDLHEGTPGDEIIAEAEAVAADLVVMGTHAREGVSRRLLGSVAEEVVENCPVPVLTVHAEDA
ncbi:universal stress protein [Halolamina litorea]|uniref:Universal stress protein n=1 Tax=Halolamina litorea TaxID=1515593 RepID=A0ABD6BSR0_9EURY|nr:universal stress protein [Halolamina litorea]